MIKILLFLSIIIFAKWTMAEVYWLHFNNGTTTYQAEAIIRKYYYIPLEKKSLPTRYSIFSENFPSELAQDNNIKIVNQSFEPTFTEHYYSPWNLSEKERSLCALSFVATSLAFYAFHGNNVWQWGSQDFGIGKEGWFGKKTYAGGADKLGHLMGLHLQKRSLNWLLIQMGYPNDTANLYSAVMVETLGLAIELGDGLSRYRFSPEDLLMDSFGVLFAYLLDKYPRLDSLVGFKIQYWPSTNYLDDRNKNKLDITSDYDGMKFFLTFRATGIPQLNEHKLIRYLSFDLGYYTRGYKPNLFPNDDKRVLTAGIGINLSELVFGISSENKMVSASSTLLKYWAPPYSFLPLAQNTFE